MAMPGNGTGVEVVSKVKGGVDVPTIVWASAAKENTRDMTIPVRTRKMIFIVNVFLIRDLITI